MEGDSIATVFKSSLGKLAQQHFQTLDDLFSCLIFFVTAFAAWYMTKWVFATLFRLFFPVVICFAFLVILNEHHSTALPKLVNFGSSIYSKISDQLASITGWNECY